MQHCLMDVTAFPVNLLTTISLDDKKLYAACSAPHGSNLSRDCTSGSLILLHGVISLSDATSYDKYYTHSV